MPRVLIVDDEPAILELLEITLGRMQLDVRSADSRQDALRLLARENFDLCLTDMRLPDGDGLDIVAHIQKHYARLPIAVITAHGSMETAIQALKLGAFDFLSKPIDIKLLRLLVRDALKLTEAVSPSDRKLVGASSAMSGLREKIRKLARNQAPIYISGESGTGKELAARMIHEQGPRAEKPFVPVNCGAIPQELMESEFFGHKKGSFTGALADKDGFFQAADGGTLFLDEVAELPTHMQVKLLRVIQEKQVRAIGEQKESAVNVRILSATHKDLSLLTRQRLFRQDLFYRINVIELQMPPLRARREDIDMLSGHILQRICTASDMAVPELSEDARAALRAYAYPGNVRELENILERAIALCERGRISAADIHLPAPPDEESDEESDAHARDPAEYELDSYLDDVEKQRIVNALEETRWNRTAAAKKLGISFRALRYRLQKLGIRQ